MAGFASWAVEGVAIHRRFASLRTQAAFLAALLLLSALAGCGRGRYPAYSPHENLLSVAAEFELLASKDPYRDEAPDELTGRNIARATLVRLANYASLHPGRFAPEVLVLRARAYELLQDYESARRSYLEAAEFDSPLGEDCVRRAALLDELLALGRLAAEASTIEDQPEALTRQATALRRFAERQAEKEPLYSSLALVEAEQAEVSRAELLAANRWLLPDGEQQAIEAFEALVRDHQTSHRSLEHALRLARLYREFAEEEARLHPPRTLSFRAERFATLVDQCTEILYRVSQADGHAERLVAQHELDAVLALREMVMERAD
ncbi:hypothetical protein HZA57_05930 [Candidatus Poribacteria bacterium]|nr:hypothetical protein [Candidatus Poribacteria bacterium]